MKSRDYQRVEKGVRYSRGKRKDVVLVVPGSVKLTAYSPMLEIYGYSVYSRLNSRNDGSVSDLGNVGVILYGNGDQQTELDRLLETRDVPVVKLVKNRDEQQKGSSGEQVVRERTNVEKASLTKLVGAFRAEYADRGKGVPTYQSKATQGSNQLGEGSAEGRKAGYAMTRMPRRSRIAKGCLPAKDRKQKA